MDKISIIIPVYNAEQSLRKCLDSVINQSYTNLEIIVINDGSKDNSLNILKEYSSIDKRIIVIDQKNAGVSSTRNKGIDLVTGEYFMFLDSDDYLSNDYVEKMYDCMIRNNSNTVTSGMTLVSTKEKCISYSSEEKVCQFDEIIDDFVNSLYFISSCKTLYKTDSINNNRFNSNLKYGEDMLFQFNNMYNSIICYCPINGYYYVQNSSSAIHKTNIEDQKKYLDDTIFVFNEILKRYPDKKLIINNRMFTKINYALSRILKDKELKYKKFKNISKDFMKYVDVSKIDLNKINYENKYNKIKLNLLKNNIYIYYIFNRFINLIHK